MPYRKLPVVTGQIYHIYNRSVDSVPIFKDRWDFQRFLKTTAYYQTSERKIKFSHPLRPDHDPEKKFPKRIEILAYCLMPNHFHFMLKQLEDMGIARFIADLTNSYSHYFNTRHQRAGHLFGGRYKAVLVETDEQLMHLSRYIHLNPVVSFVAKSLDEYLWSSYKEYLEPEKEKVSSPSFVLDLFSSPQRYKQFVQDNLDYGKKLEIIKHLTLE